MFLQKRFIWVMPKCVWAATLCVWGFMRHILIGQLGQTWKRNVCLVQHPGVGAGSRWPGCQRGGGGNNRWKPGWPVDIYERAFSKNWDTVFKRGGGPRKPGTIHHPVKTGWPVDIHERAFQKYKGKKGKVGTVAYCPVKTRVTRGGWILTRFR
jgi:hypothetical protein